MLPTDFVANLGLTFLIISCVECVLFKRLFMDGALWPKYIHTTMTGNIQSVMECSGLCGTSGSNCTVFVPDLGSNSCHLGTLDNAQVGVLAAQAGISETYVEYETLTAVLNEQYYKLTAITSEATWQSFIYSTVTLPPGGDILNCPNACQEDQHCEMFVYNEGKCYFGNSTYDSGSITESLSNKDVYILKDNLGNFTGGMSEAEDGLGSSWTKYVQSSRQQVTLANDCKGICKLEGCQFYVHDNIDEVCYLCHTSAFDESSTLSIANPTIGGYNPSELDLSLLVHFRPRTTTKSNLYKYQRYNHVYKVIRDIADNVTCLFYCYFDPDNNCQFFVVMSSIDLDDFRCHLGHFNSSIPAVASIGSKTYGGYVYTENLVDFDYVAEFPTNVSASQKEISSRIVEELSVESELECAAHMILYQHPTKYYRAMFYSMQNPTTCLIGSFYTNQTATTEITDYEDVKLYLPGVKEMQYNFFDEYTFPNHDFINTYIFATIEMDPDHILDHCFVYCKLAETNCYFVRYEASQNLCLLGSLDSTWTEVTTPINEKIFIGNEMLTKYFIQDNFYNHDVKEVGEWIYNHAGPGVSSKACALICFHEPECDFALLFNDECFLGDYSYTGYPLNEAPMTEVIENSYAKKMVIWTPVNDVKAQYFQTASEETTSEDFLISEPWFLMFSRVKFFLDDNDAEGDCAAGCLLNSGGDPCHAYIALQRTCFFFDFSVVSTAPWAPGSDLIASTTFQIKSSLIDSGIQEAYEKLSEDMPYLEHPCLNSGYVELPLGSSIAFDTNPVGSYGDNYRCYWGVFAPNAKKIRIDVQESSVQPNDGLKIYVGLSFMTPMLASQNGESLIQAEGIYEVESQFLILEFSSDGDLVDTGMRGQIMSIVN